MAALDGYDTLLRDLGHFVEIESITGLEMKQVLLKAVEVTFKK